jgi:hypothetical protein
MEACKEVINSISAYKFQVKQSKSFTMLRDLEFFLPTRTNARESARIEENGPEVEPTDGPKPRQECESEFVKSTCVG